ncbi:hypothetical protein BDN72DRAFT_128663 [Pluteus cervinus]|uniref:Uncharacterized protein n=1 Tax=Pluteus cervinus TaxID=181527 RepID=A0ACD3AMW8_9AGAR|nr:hypothetical protein BDN72DRAFT_128663 [Pluteus cervinus]
MVSSSLTFPSLGTFYQSHKRSTYLAPYPFGVDPEGTCVALPWSWFWQQVQVVRMYPFVLFFQFVAISSMAFSTVFWSTLSRERRSQVDEVRPKIRYGTGIELNTLGRTFQWTFTFP